MTIKNVINDTDTVLQATLGTVTTLPGSLSRSSGNSGAVLSSACHKGAVWFEGRCWTWGALNTTPPQRRNLFFRRFDNQVGGWTPVPGFQSNIFITNFTISTGDNSGQPALISFDDSVYMFTGKGREAQSSGSFSVNYGYMRWTPAINDPSNFDGDTTVTPTSYTSPSYTKSFGFACSHVTDAFEFNGTIFIGTSNAILSFVPPGGTLTALDEMPASSDWTTDRTAKAFGIFKSVSDAVPSLYCVFNDGLIKKIAGTVSTVADISILDGSLVSGINTVSVGPLDPVEFQDIGYGPACVQVGNEFFVWLNNSTGTIMYKTSNGTTFTDETSTLPSSWQSTNSHIKVAVDGSDITLGQVQDTVRVMFVDASSNAFEIFTFDGTTFTSLGSAGTSGMASSYTFFDDGAPDIEITAPVTTDASAGTADISYSIFRQVPEVNGADVAVEYSIDGGLTWFTATAASGSGEGSETLTGLEVVRGKITTDVTNAPAPGDTLSITSVGTLCSATVNHHDGLNHGLETGDTVIIAGAGEPEYNGTFVVTVTGLTTFDYTALSTPSGSPATGTITWDKQRDHYTFVWDFASDLGTGLFPNVKIRIRSV
jgi:hypothetical protein